MNSIRIINNIKNKHNLHYKHLLRSLTPQPKISTIQILPHKYMENKNNSSYSFRKLHYSYLSENQEIPSIPSIPLLLSQPFPAPCPSAPVPTEPVQPNLLNLSSKIKSDSEVITTQTIKCLSQKFLQNEETLLKLKTEQAMLIRAYQKYKSRQYRYQVDTAIHLSLQPSLSQPAESQDFTYEELLELGENIGSVPTGLTSDEIQRIPSTYSDTENCSICLTTVNQGKILPCCHSFHSECIDQWLVTKRTCPVCLHEVR